MNAGPDNAMSAVFAHRFFKDTIEQAVVGCPFVAVEDEPSPGLADPRAPIGIAQELDDVPRDGFWIVAEKRGSRRARERSPPLPPTSCTIGFSMASD
jgi:hypothetical protein